MCQFCVEHGEGKRWYLQANNYAYDLESDLKRRDYILGFVRGFDTMRATAITGMEVLGKLPGPLERAGKAAISNRQKAHHFGQPLTIEDCERVFDVATSITVIPCICRMHAANQPAEEVCVLVTTQPVDTLLQDAFRDYVNGPDLDDFHKLEKDAAIQLLRDSEKRGLMHSIWTFQTPFTAAICNCNLESGCMAMKLTAGYKMNVMFRGEDVAQFDLERCTGCGACARICPFEAISMDGRTSASSSAGGRARIAHQRIEECWGCGICRSVCRADAISMIDRRQVPAVAALW